MENIYSQVKMFHFHEKLNAIGAGKITAPVHIRLKPINACNHRCFYCCYRNDNLFLSELLNEKDMIPREKMHEIVKDIANGGVKAVTFTGGGEPLIYPFISETVQYLLGHQIKVAVLTNGSALKGNVADILARGASWVRISMDATDPESLARTRKIDPEEFDSIVRNIQCFANMKHKDCELGINFIVTKLNWRNIYPFLRFMKENGVDHVKISECIVSTTGDENKMYHQAHYDAVRSEINRAKQDLPGETFRIIDKFHDMDDKFDKKYTWCPFIRFLNVIGADMNVYSCQDKAYTTSGCLGSIRNISLKQLWETVGYREKVKTINPSRDCNHHCVSHGKNMSLIDYLTTDRRHLEFV